MKLYKQNKLVFALLSAGLLFSASSALAQAEDSQSIADAVTTGKASVSLRYRFEFVDQDGFSQDAKASTLRTRLNYRTARWNNFSVFLEADNVSHIIWDDFNSAAGTSAPGKNIYPVVADPKGTEINQAYLDYNFSDDNFIRGGRQRILLDNQRFVGGVGWRQNEQTYDAVSYTSTFNNKAKLFVGYVWNVNRIFGEGVPAGDQKQDTFLANLAFPISGAGKLVTYWYDIDNEDATGFSTSTFGAKWAGKIGGDDAKFSYALEYAYQADKANNPVDYSADYYRLDAAFKIELVTLFAGFESLGGDKNRAGAAFRTPLATLHAFNGWADKFLATPSAGLNDFFLGAKGKLGKNKWTVVYHDYDAEDGSTDFGSEFDAVLVTPINKNYSLLFKAAFYSGAGGYPDTTKLWVMATAKF